jgi:hypothetical protein
MGLWPEEAKKDEETSDGLTSFEEPSASNENGSKKRANRLFHHCTTSCTG